MSNLQPYLKELIRQDLPDFKVGDTLRVEYKIKEKEFERVVSFEGIVISKRGEGLNKTFTVRKISFGVGVERIFPLNSPSIVNIKIIKHNKVRRAKLYYLRKKIEKMK